MKIISTVLVTIILLSSVAFAQQDSTTFKVKITILGTLFKKDVDVISKNLEKMPQMSGFAPSVISQNHVEFTGTYTGDTAGLVSDIESLASNRFTVKAKNQKGTLDVTMRKIEANMPFTPAE